MLLGAENVKLRLAGTVVQVLDNCLRVWPALSFDCVQHSLSKIADDGSELADLLLNANELGDLI